MEKKFDRRTKNVEIFEDLMDKMKTNEILHDAVSSSIRAQKLYLQSDEAEIPANPGKTCRTVVSPKRSYEAASVYAREGKKTCVLNFASATNPGGGVTRGSTAQEESLCRSSTLYPCLDEKSLWDNFYGPHRSAENPLYNDDCIYTPGVCVCKSDVSFPERLNEKDWYFVDVLTCAAPNLRRIPSNSMNPHAGSRAAEIREDDLMQLHLKRIERIFRVAAANGAEALVLGAFGCGAFRNPPEIVAEAFRVVQETYEGYFDVIENAVYCGHSETKNYDTFCNVLGRDRTE